MPQLTLTIALTIALGWHNIVSANSDTQIQETLNTNFTCGKAELGFCSPQLFANIYLATNTGILATTLATIALQKRLSHRNERNSICASLQIGIILDAVVQIFMSSLYYIYCQNSTAIRY